VGLKLSTLVVSGGVASNQNLKAILQEVAGQYQARVVVPPAYLCQDNGIMIAWTGLCVLSWPICSPIKVSSI
jgi:N6-L-threonylcarbamoyladenine synthase